MWWFSTIGNDSTRCVIISNGSDRRTDGRFRERDTITGGKSGVRCDKHHQREGYKRRRL